jgi:hypothetical protein
VASWLDKYRGFEVEIQYLTDNNMYKDRGRLQDFGDTWLELHKGRGPDEVFIIPTTAVRLMKVIQPPAQAGSSTLLRPVEAPVEQRVSAADTGGISNDQSGR